MASVANYSIDNNVRFDPLEVIDIGKVRDEGGPRQGFAVPKGVVHRTRAPGRTTMLMIAVAG